jgi:copper resistance protein D
MGASHSKSLPSPSRGRESETCGKTKPNPMDSALAAVRFAHFVALQFVFGAGLFASGFAPAALRAEIAPRLKGGTIAASLVALVSALAWLALEAASMSGDPASALDLDTIREVLDSTLFGAAWLGRLPLLAALALIASLAPATKPAATTLVAALALGSLALVDHAAMQSGGLGLAHRANDALHLLLTGGWLGGLPAFALTLRLAARAELAHDAEVAMLRFSAIGQFAVVGILATGSANIAMTGGHVPWPPSTPYRALLAAKIGVVLVMIALAIFNRFVLLPRIEHGARTLRALALIELALALTAVALVSSFGLLDPA